mgnify:CR=1 FL=1
MTDAPLDIVIVIALQEEFEQLHARIKDRCTPVQDPETNDYDYVFTWPEVSARPYRCVARFAGKMGERKAGLVTQRLLEHFPDPQDALLRQRLEALCARATAVTLGTADLEDLPPARAWAERLVLAPACGVLIVQAPTERLTGGSSVEAGARVAKGLAVAVERLMSREPVGALVLRGGGGVGHADVI